MKLKKASAIILATALALGGAYRMRQQERRNDGGR